MISTSKFSRRVVLAMLALAASSAVYAQAPAWRDTTKTPDQRAKDLLAQLTLEEKIALCHADGTFTTPGVPRLGVGKFQMSDGPQGVREEHQASGWNPAGRDDDFATAMPACVGLAATFDPEMAKAYGNVLGEEASFRNKNVLLCPGLNIMRTPLNGRNCEYFGEDPYLASRIAVGYINALQSHGVAASAKHYAMNNQETNRNSVNAKVDERVMREIYLPAFKASVMEAKALTIMTAYNRVNGLYCSENEFLLNKVLKGDWGFEGLVMTDWGGCHSTVAAANNGLDLEMGSNVSGNHNNDFLAGALLTAVNNGQVPKARLDDMALRNLRVMAATGLLDEKPKKSTVPLMAPAHIETTRKIAESACVLLKNEKQALPIDASKVKSIAVIGANAQAKFANDGMSAAIKTKYEITPLEGITQRAGDGVTVKYAAGYAGAGARGGMGRRGGAGAAPNPEIINEAVALAKSSDVAIVIAGLYRGQDQEAADRPNMDLPAGQSELIQAVTKANPKTIVVLTGGSPSNVNPWITDAASLVMYWYGGTEGGNAMARVLFGDVNPAGHLPCSWPKALSDSPAHNAGDANQYPGTGGGRGGMGGGGGGGAMTPESGPQQVYSEGLYVGYRWFDSKKIEPQFPFGHGLSYTSFAMSDLKVDGGADGNASVTVKVANTGAREGAEVVQLYVAPAKPSVDRPVKELKAFGKINLTPGANGTVTMKLDPNAFAFYDVAKHAWIAEAGEYTLLAGDSAASTPLKATVKIDKTVVIPEGK